MLNDTQQFYVRAFTRDDLQALMLVLPPNWNDLLVGKKLRQILNNLFDEAELFDDYDDDYSHDDGHPMNFGDR